MINLTYVIFRLRILRTMDGLSLTIKKCSVPLKLDNHTEGHGNCFPNAIVQQCRRPEIKEWLLANKPLAFVRSHQTLRRKVSNFALESEHKTLSDYRRNYENILGNSDRNWKEYWTGMGKEGTWVDSVFVQVTAWFIGLDMKILTTSSTPSHPFVMVNGDINDPSTASSGPPLLLGNYTNVHYQSLLPVTNITKPQENKSSQDPVDSIVSIKDEFIYLHRGVQITFPKFKDEKLQCPFCDKSFSRITSHVNSKQCNISKSNIDLKEFAIQFSSFIEGFRLELGRKRKQKSQAKLIVDRGEDARKKEK